MIDSKQCGAPSATCEGHTPEEASPSLEISSSNNAEYWHTKNGLFHLLMPSRTKKCSLPNPTTFQQQSDMLEQPTHGKFPHIWEQKLKAKQKKHVFTWTWLPHTMQLVTRDIIHLCPPRIKWERNLANRKFHALIRIMLFTRKKIDFKIKSWNTTYIATVLKTNGCCTSCCENDMLNWNSKPTFKLRAAGSVSHTNASRHQYNTPAAPTDFTDVVCAQHVKKSG